MVESGRIVDFAKGYSMEQDLSAESSKRAKERAWSLTR